QQAPDLEQVQDGVGGRHSSLGSLSEATDACRAEHLRQIVRELADRAVPLEHGRDAEALRGLTAVDGTIVQALPRMAWALWMDPGHRAAKIHLHFEVIKGVPVDDTLTQEDSSEPSPLRTMLQTVRIYVMSLCVYAS